MRDFEQADAWGAIHIGGERLGPWLSTASIRSSRAGVHETIGMWWAREGETWQQGWRRAYRKGWRAVRVVCAPCSAYVDQLREQGLVESSEDSS